MLDDVHGNHDIERWVQCVQVGEVASDDFDSLRGGVLRSKRVHLDARAAVAAAQMIKKAAIKAAHIKHRSDIAVLSNDGRGNLPVPAFDWVVLPG